MHVQPYLMFDGRCEEALNFYKTALGAEVKMMMRLKECPDPNMPAPGPNADKILHASFTLGDSTINASDGHCAGKPVFQGVTLTITVADDAEADRVFNALAKGGKVQMPLTKTFFSSKFGMASDPFGVSWMVIVAH